PGERGRAQGLDLIDVDRAVDLVPRLHHVLRHPDQGIADVSPEVVRKLVTGPDGNFRDYAEGRVRVQTDVAGLGEKSAGDDAGATSGRERGRAINGYQPVHAAESQLAAEVQ